MARIDEALFERLSENATLAALIDTRVYPGLAPQAGPWPAVVYTRITGSRESAFSEDMGLAHGTFQFDAWAVKYTEARAVADAVLGALKRADFTSAGGVVVLDALLESERDIAEPEAKLYRVSLDLIVWWRTGTGD